MLETIPFAFLKKKDGANGTNKSKRFKSFLSSACDVLLVLFRPTGELYAEQSESQGFSVRISLESAF